MPPTSSPSPRTTSPTSGRLAPVSADPAPLFVYGSLRFPEVLHVLIDRDPTRVPASALGWRVVTLPERVYPAVIPDPHTAAPGHLLTDLTPAEWDTLDAFEADIYTLDRLTLTDGGHGWAYTCTDTPELAHQAAWSPDVFAREHLTAYVERCAAWRKRYEQAR
ncbi:gamma-glutamylcyclotransferase [Frankia sp. CNm7]|uniref:Putative gamma-glutamylcyclotransferase n=1 Tax=Frankia nepalensis TaxID=1836974 RepID=A0A937RCN6_9ACTN|nr:gamma-glutamylcyclotransferase family protein [Frankia nepalensis]MBL7495838.1 gamma-glutamylcyclotransferase [Frankia nepalensis]MBL7509914.1 gamma-glutamylcyclotransferase [Frankia nepalensis]MBL7521086.1 gamma-glutamylcyclotransferase [Frankia nepalensis]MBL7629673.1 gamma-glutamylcyclotransferase [Frankia nepalensis]